MRVEGDQSRIPLEVTGVVWDKEGLVARVGGDVEIACQVVGLFVSDLPRQVQEIRDGLGDPRGEEVKRIAHSIKGAAGNVGADALAQVARWFEEHASEAGIQDRERVLERMAAEVDRFAKEVEARRS